MNDIEELRMSVRGIEPDRAVVIITEYLTLHPEDDEALTLRGMNLAAININPDSKAQMAMKATYEILDFYNKDLYNP